MKTYVPTNNIKLKKEWFVVDVTDMILGRIASKIAMRLRGKHKFIFTPYLDLGDFIIVINAEKIRLTGKKWDKKIYYRHSGYPGGLSSISAKEIKLKWPEKLIRTAVRGMLPKNRLGRHLIKKLKVYAGSEHPHMSQQPELLVL